MYDQSDDEKKCVGSVDPLFPKTNLLMNFEDKSMEDLSKTKTKVVVHGKTSFANVGKVGSVSVAFDNGPSSFSGKGAYILVPKSDNTQFVGDFTIEFRPDVAPIACASFVNLVQREFFDGLLFYRHSPVIRQAGNPFNDADVRDSTGTRGSRRRRVEVPARQQYTGLRRLWWHAWHLQRAGGRHRR